MKPRETLLVPGRTRTSRKTRQSLGNESKIPTTPNQLCIFLTRRLSVVLRGIDIACSSCRADHERSEPWQKGMETAQRVVDNRIAGTRGRSAARVPRLARRGWSTAANAPAPRPLAVRVRLPGLRAPGSGYGPTRLIVSAPRRRSPICTPQEKPHQNRGLTVDR